MAKILVIEDDTLVAAALEEALATQGHVVECVGNGEDGLYRLKYFHYEMAIIDWNLPGMSGVDVCRNYRAEGGKLPILFLTGRSDTTDKIEALDIGADDYLTKPFSYRELMARLRALLRRPPEFSSQVLTLGHVELDREKKQVRRSGEPVELAASEYALLELLMSNPGRIFSSDELIERMFSSESDATELAVRQRILRLRKKIDLDDSPSLIKTIKGLGYKMEV
ncbi:MAG TPA: response regulator transcription factor [Candidatus Obscuribacterales bacterium]